MIDDIIYFSSLLMCILLGGQSKKITDPDLKRIFGTGVGILVVYLICWNDIYHSILIVGGNVFIIKWCKKSYVHLLSMIYTWIYLLYVHANSISIYMIWIYQTMSLRLVGLAFDLNSSKPSKTYPMSLPVEDTNMQSYEPTAMEIIAYSYCYVGLHRGPYYRWPVYRDHFTTSYGVSGDFRLITEHKLKKAMACALAYLFLTIEFPLQVYYEDTFYTSNGSDYRYLYNASQLAMFFLRYQMTMMLCTSVCTEAGFGVYPTKCVSRPGHGPSEQFQLLKNVAAANKMPSEKDCDFALLKCIENKKLLLGPKMKDTLRSWDMPTRYWFWSNINRNLLKFNQEVRTACSFTAWLLWRGPSLQLIIVCATLWVYINIEDEYSVIYDTTGPMKAAWDIGFSIMRMLCLIYLAPCLTINDTSIVLQYYNSIFWVFHFLMLILLLGIVVVIKSRTEVLANRVH